MKLALKKAVTALAIVSVAAACSKKDESDGDDAADSSTTVASNGGGNTTTTTAEVTVDNAVVSAVAAELVVPGTLSLIPAKGDGLGLSLADIQGHRVNYYVQEDSVEAVKQASSILCYVAQTGYNERVNKGAYTALVDAGQCEDKDEGDSGDGQQGGGQSAAAAASQQGFTYEPWVVEATQESATKPVVVRFWISEKKEGREKLIHVRMRVTSPVTADAPFGVFDLNFAMPGQGGGYLKVSNKNVIFREAMAGEDQGGTYSQSVRAAVNIVKNGNSTSGKLVTESVESFTSSEHSQSKAGSYQVAFSDSRLLRAGISDSVQANGCFDFNAVNGRANRYSLYDAAGNLVKLNSGFPLELTLDGETVRGQAGYWGLWAEGDRAGELVSGQEVSRVEYGNGGAKSVSTYTVVRGDGRLVEYTAALTTLGALKGVPLKSYSQEGQLIAEWDGTSFVKKALVTYSQDGEQQEAVSGEVTAQYGGHRFWVDSLQADIFVKEGQAADATELRYFVRHDVTADGDVGSELVCFQNCVKGTVSAEELQNGNNWNASSSPYIRVAGNGGQQMPMAQNVVTPLATYTWDGADFALKLGGSAIAIPPATGGQGNQGGGWLGTGALVRKADWEALALKAQIGSFQLEQLVDRFYRWESGSSAQSRFVGLRDADGALVRFDQPLKIQFEFGSAVNMNAAPTAYDGKQLRVDYGGPGQLYGLPMERDAQRGHQVPEVSLRAGAIIGAGAGSPGYVVMPHEVELTLAPLADDQCVGLSLAEGLPSLPADPIVPIDNGAVPADTVTLFIGGVLQTAAP